MALLQELNHELVQTKCVELFDDQNPLILESGAYLDPVHVAYETYGSLNADGTNAILICHALTANAHAAGKHTHNDKTSGWWDSLIGPGRAFDTDHYFVVCPNILGSCYGTTGPASLNPSTGELYRQEFPQFTIRDLVAVQKRLLDFLDVQELVTISGSSLGGMQVLEWPLMYPEFCKSIIPISTAARQTAWCIALNTAARTAIMNDPDWNDGEYELQPSRGLSLARMIGMISYRSGAEFEARFGSDRYQIQNYLSYQGEKLVSRFDANTYLYLTLAMDSHDITRGRDTLAKVLADINCPVCCIGFSSDVRYPVSDQQELVDHMPNAQLHVLNSIHGHDAFLIEFDAMSKVITTFLEDLPA
ncbi:MAG TPA: homoserine O-acetyltransferase [Acidobacteriota bacterium]|nr:homoserine O-acetyltransferase [Acidobacteriota bacterium]